MCVLNQPACTQDEGINKLRGAIMHRALWMGLILKEAKDRGLDWEALGRSGIFRTGLLHGADIRQRMEVPGSLVSFGKTFFNEDILKIFEIRVTQIDEQALRLEYGHCPLVAAWQRLGIEGELLETLCDIAMAGDRGISECFGEFRFELGKTIAQGHSHCDVAFVRGT
jgi:hypothetical protein